MYKITVNEKPEIEVEIENGKYFVSQMPVDIDIVKNNDGTFHALHKGLSYSINVIEKFKHNLVLEINNKKYRIKLKNELEDLLVKMGMENLGENKMDEIKAPMPGMVLKIMVSVGENVKKGDNLIILEAMKMENIIKATGEGVVSAINVKQGDKVEKNQLILKF